MFILVYVFWLRNGKLGRIMATGKESGSIRELFQKFKYEVMNINVSYLKISLQNRRKKPTEIKMFSELKFRAMEEWISWSWMGKKIREAGGEGKKDKTVSIHLDFRRY